MLWRVGWRSGGKGLRCSGGGYATGITTPAGLLPVSNVVWTIHFRTFKVALNPFHVFFFIFAESYVSFLSYELKFRAFLTAMVNCYAIEIIIISLPVARSLCDTNCNNIVTPLDKKY